MYPAALSDDGSLVYAIRIDGNAEKKVGGELWILRESSTTKLCSHLQNLTQDIYFNIDCSQVLFASDKGICFSQNGSEAILLEPSEELTITSEACKSQGIYYSDSYSYSSQYTGTQNLYNVLLNVHYENSRYNNLWYFNENMESVLLFEDNKNLQYELKGDSLLIYDKLNLELKCIDDIYSKINLGVSLNVKDANMIGTGISSYLYTKDKTIYCSKIGEGLIRYSSDGERDSICTDCGLIGYFPRENEPDVIYYRIFTNPEKTDGVSEYISHYYFDLYMIEDIPNAVPIKISENVGSVHMGDFGVYYLKLKSISPNIEHLYSEEHNNCDELDDCYSYLYDQNQLFYSSDGKTFSYGLDLLEWYLYGG